MMTPLRIVLFGLVLLLLGLKPVFGGDSVGGGDGGIIILPSAVSVASLGSLESPREVVEIANSSADLVLMLPSNMGDSVAILSLPDEETTTILILRNGRLYLSGRSLTAIRASGVKSFVITIVSAEGMALRIVYRFEANNAASLIIF